jgi:hypothetical protein
MLDFACTRKKRRAKTTFPKDFLLVLWSDGALGGYRWDVPNYKIIAKMVILWGLRQVVVLDFFRMALFLLLISCRFEFLGIASYTS